MKHSIFAIFFLGIFLRLTSTHRMPFYRTDYKYFEEFDAFYKVHWGVRGGSWKTAFYACADEGATLFYPKAQGEWSLVKNLTDSVAEVPKVTDIFVGFHNEYNLGEFITVDGHPLPDPLASDSSLRPDPLAHSSLLPNYNDYCLSMNIESGLFKVDSCFRNPYTAIPFMCKRVDENLCPTVDRSYKYMNASQKCYKINKKQQLWNEAMKTCFIEGGILAVIENKAQAEEIRDMVEPGVSYFVGVRKLINSNVFYTVKGKKFSDMYQKFSDMYQKFSDMYQRALHSRYYGTVCNRNNNLYTETAQHIDRLPFICEMEVAV